MLFLCLSSQMIVTRYGEVSFTYIIQLKGVLGSSLNPLGNSGNRTDPRVQVLQVGRCIQDLWKKHINN